MELDEQPTNLGATKLIWKEVLYKVCTAAVVNGES